MQPVKNSPRTHALLSIDELAIVYRNNKARLAHLDNRKGELASTTAVFRRIKMELLMENIEILTILLKRKAKN